VKEFNHCQLFKCSFSDSAGFIAMALSDDAFMGDDSAIECVNEGGVVKAYTSFTRAIPGDFGAKRSDIVKPNNFNFENLVIL
jgi:hypothetical protein